jgi:replicative superfamily II helicase
MNKLNQPNIQAEIAFLIAQEIPQREIARRYNTYQAKISRMAHEPEMIDLIIKEKNKLIKLTKRILRKLDNDPHFRKEFEERIENMMYDFKWLFRL